MNRDGMSEQRAHSTRSVNGVNLHVVEAGSQGGPAVLLLHGFPEFWFGWRHQIGALADAGFRTIVPDQRGYGQSEKPRPVSAYRLEQLAADVAGLIGISGRPRASLVGHDWGGLVAWWFAMTRPDIVERLVILNSPHPVAFRKHLRSSPRQMLKSWYAFFFQIPWLPEVIFRQANWRRLTEAVRGSSRPGTFTDADLDRYRSAWSEPGAITAMINWYRAAMRDRSTPPSDTRVRVPTLIIWGTSDNFLDRPLAEASLACCDQGRLELIDSATHWLQHEEPERVNRLLIDFLTPSADGRAAASAH